MSDRLEIEGKYYLKNTEKLLETLDKKGFKYTETVHEKDEYFTDFNNEFIKNRICLRLRTTNKENVELTYKAKSKSFDSTYAKLEKNIDINIKDYESLVEILYSLGYKSYVIVDKTRQIYTRKENNLEYNVMIDHIENCGDFVEFEIITDKSNTDAQIIFDKYLKEMNVNTLEIADLPYRDIVKK